MKTTAMLCLVCLACAGGCAGHRPGKLAPSADALSSGDPFAALVAALPEGAALSVSTPLVGEALVSVGPAYRSGLDATCRQAVAETDAGEREIFAVCRHADGLWTYVPPIFERMPR